MSTDTSFPELFSHQRGVLTQRKGNTISEREESDREICDDKASAVSASHVLRLKLRKEAESRKNSLTRRAAALVFNLVFMIFETFFLKPSGYKNTPNNHDTVS